MVSCPRAVLAAVAVDISTHCALQSEPADCFVACCVFGHG